MIRETDPLGNVREFHYDQNGNRIELIDRNGRRSTFDYDKNNRLKAETWFEGATQTYVASWAYDAIGNLLMTQDDFSKYAYTYDALNRVLTEDNAGSPNMPHVILNYAYDKDGNRLSVRDDAGVEVASVYGSRNELKQRSWQGGGIDPARIDFGYNAALMRTSATRFSNLAGTTIIGSSAYDYDESGRIKSIVHSWPLGQTIADYHYTFDIANQLTGWSHHGDTAVYTYDLTGQLIGADHTVLPDEFFNYDKNGNRIRSSGSSTYVTGPGNQLKSDDTFRYAYDREGNLRTKTEIATGNVTTYAYDYHNRLMHVTEASAGGILLNESSYTYDIQGRRSGITTNGQTIHTAYIGDNAWADYAAGGAVKARYLFGDRIDSNLARWQPGAGTAWYLTDHLGSVRDVVNTAGAVVNHVDYSSFGNVLGQTNRAAGDRYSFAGREREVGGDLYLRARNLNPGVGRFVGADPVSFNAGDSNLNRYVGNHPTTATDPNGLVAIVEYEGLLSIGFGSPGSALGAGIGYLVGYGVTNLAFLAGYLETVQITGAGHFDTAVSIATLILERSVTGLEQFDKIPKAETSGSSEGFTGGFIHGYDPNAKISISFSFTSGGLYPKALDWILNKVNGTSLKSLASLINKQLHNEPNAGGIKNGIASALINLAQQRLT